MQNNPELFISLRIEYWFVPSHRCRYNARLNSRPIPDRLLPRELMIFKGPSTLATLFSHRWPRFCGGPEHTRATCGGDSKISYPPAVSVLSKVSYPTEWLPHATRTIASVLAAERRTQPQKRSVCGGDEPQPVAHLSHKLQCARQSLKIMVSCGNKYPRHKNAATCG